MCHPFRFAASLTTLLLSISVSYSSLSPLWLSALLCVSLSLLSFPQLSVSQQAPPHPCLFQECGQGLGAGSRLTVDAVSGGQGWAGEWQPTPLTLIHQHPEPTMVWVPESDLVPLSSPLWYPHHFLLSNAFSIEKYR